MDRFEFEDLISAYIENDLPLNKRKEIDAYLDENPSQNQIIKQIANNMEVLKKLPKVASKKNFNQKLMERIKSNNFDMNPAATKRKNIFGFTYLNASALIGLIFLLLALSFEITGLRTGLKNNNPYQITDSKKLLGNSDVVKKDEREPTANPSLTTLQKDTTKKGKVDFSRNIKFVND